MNTIIDLQSLIIFELVAQKGSISKAAHELNYAQSNISTKIQQLENFFQVSLFYRNNRGVTLTPKGQILLKYTKKIFHLIDETTKIIKDDNIPKGPLRIGSMETIAAIYLPRLFAKYHKEYPNVKLILKTGTTEKNIQDILQYNLDGAFIAGSINNSEIIQKTFTEEKLVLVTDVARPQISSIKDIQNQTLIVFPNGCFYRKILEQWLQNKGLLANKIMEFDTLEAIIGCICAGLGISLLPISVVNKYVKAGILRCYPIENSYTKVPVLFIYRKLNYMPTSLLKFINMF
ncbi:DNA-binding transcriptional LysR family regulator [Clostridium algifaecis]|uniref:DNA-binding transcriptional LysR family regulator n=1 Tax=Clostridium algifaecis TaxID=1472040 RepID=A0ABS4KN85_9CLOT|nr:LysR family transcriptional regulator [Clostridium algifaecis]MBP2031498.1 DNA-binding transcriptional LysR family regulator [Clostridium algifaecis]